MARHIIDIEDVPSHLTSKVKQNLKFKTGNFIWRVRFNTPLDPKSVNSNTMYVVNSSNHKIRCNIKYDNDTGQIEIEPLEAYSTNEYYHLVITTHVKSKGGQSLKEPVTLKFKL